MDATPIGSSVKAFPTTLIVSPFSILSGILVKGSNKYRPANLLGWILCIVGSGLLTLLKADATTGQWVGFQIVVAAGIGIVVCPLSFRYWPNT